MTDNVLKFKSVSDYQQKAERSLSTYDKIMDHFAIVCLNLILTDVFDHWNEKSLRKTSLPMQPKDANIFDSAT